MNILAQIIGILAIIAFAISPQQKNKKGVLIFQLLSSVLYALQYLLLNAFSAVVTNIVGAIKCYVFYLYEKKGKKIPKYIFLIFMVLVLIFGIFSFTNIYSIIPIFVSVTMLYSTWQSNLKIYRIIMVITTALWLVYNCIVGAYVGAIGNTFQLISGITAIVRLDIMKKSDKKIISKEEIK